MSIFNSLFGGQQQQQQAQGQQGQQQPNQQQQQQQQSQQQNQPQGGPGTTPEQNNQSGGNGGNAGTNSPANPMDAYSKMFDNQATNSDKAPSFTIAPEVMDNVVKQQDFTKGMNPELFQKVLQGDQNAFMEVMNTVGRNAYRSAIEHGGMLTDQFVGAREKYSEKGFSSKIKQELTSNALSGTPNYQHPVVKQQLTEIATRMSKLHPDATPQEIAEMSKRFLADMSSAVNPTPNQNQETSKKEVDWDQFFA